MPAHALKQRLAALSASIPRPGDNAAPQSSNQSTAANRARAFFRPAFPRRQSDSSLIRSDEYVSQVSSHGSWQEKLQEVMSRMIFQAGVDYESVLRCVFENG